jgi:hypothetical protein
MSFEICSSISTQNVSLQNFLDDVPDVPLRQALELMHPCLADPSLIKDAVLHSQHLQLMMQTELTPVAGLDRDLELSLRMYFDVSSSRLYRELHKAFLSGPQRLQPYAAYAKIFLRAMLTVMKQPNFCYDGPAYKAFSTSHDAELKRQCDSYASTFAAGTFLTFPSFFSATTSDTNLDELSKISSGGHVVMNFTRLRGVRSSSFSDFGFEEEVVVPPPSMFRILSAAKINGGLVLTLESVDSPLAYITTTPPASPIMRPAAATSSQPPQHSLILPPHRASSGLQACDTSDLVFDPATEPKEGGYGKQTRHDMHPAGSAYFIS